MAKTHVGSCPCGFGFTTPHGQDDAVAVMQYHLERIHKKDFPKGATREVALQNIKEK